LTTRLFRIAQRVSVCLVLDVRNYYASINTWSWIDQELKNLNPTIPIGLRKKLV